MSQYGQTQISQYGQTQVSVLAVCCPSPWWHVGSMPNMSHSMSEAQSGRHLSPCISQCLCGRWSQAHSSLPPKSHAGRLQGQKNVLIVFYLTPVTKKESEFKQTLFFFTFGVISRLTHHVCNGRSGRPVGPKLPGEV